MAKLSSTSETRRPTPFGRSPRRVYVFLVSAVTCFVVGLIVARSPVTGYRATAIVQVQPTADVPFGPENGQTNTHSRHPFSRESLRSELATLRNADGRLIGDRGSRDLDPLIRCQKLASRGGEQRFRIGYVGTGERESVLILNKLIRQVVTSPANQQHDLSFAARDEVWKGRRRESEAINVLRGGLEEYFQKLRSTAELVATGANDSKKPATGASSDGSSASSENPEWTRLLREIHLLEDERNRLLLRVTAAHPKVLELDINLDQLRRTLNKIPRFLGGDALPLNAPQGSDINIRDDAAAQSSVNVRHSKLAQQVQELAGGIDRVNQLWSDLNSAHQEFDQQLLAAQPGALNSNSSSIQNPVRVVEDARLESVIGGRPSLTKLLALGLLASIAGAAMAWCIGPPTRVLSSAVHVEQCLSVPLIGVISSSSGSATNDLTAIRARKFALKLLLAFEILLVALVIIGLCMCLTDSPLAARFCADPLTTISEFATRI